MKPADFLFRFRRLALFVIFALAFWAPWTRLGGAHPGSTWLWLAGTLTATGILSIATSTIVVVAVATLVLLLAAALRTWATAYLGPEVVFGDEIRSDRVVADGPYRYVRHPLYLGMSLLTAALSILMPPGGAVFAVIAEALLTIVLVLGEERRLSAEGGQVYAAYRMQVPAFFPSVVPKIPAGTARPRWLQGFLGEIHLWGMTMTYLLFAHRYSVTILQQGVLISVGIMFLVRAIWRPAKPPTP